MKYALKFYGEAIEKRPFVKSILKFPTYFMIILGQKIIFLSAVKYLFLYQLNVKINSYDNKKKTLNVISKAVHFQLGLFIPCKVYVTQTKCSIVSKDH